MPKTPKLTEAQLNWMATGIAYFMLGSGYPRDYMDSCIDHVKEKYNKDLAFASILHDLHTLLETAVKHDSPFTDRLEKLTRVLLSLER